MKNIPIRNSMCTFHADGTTGVVYYEGVDSYNRCIRVGYKHYQINEDLRNDTRDWKEGKDISL